MWDCFFFSGGTLYPSANLSKLIKPNQNLKLLVLLSYLGGLKVKSRRIDELLGEITKILVPKI